MEKSALVVLLRIGAYFAVLPWLGAVLLVLTGAPTWSGVAYVAGIGALLGALIRPSRQPLARGALGFLFAVACVRAVSAGAGTTMHFEPSARLVDRVVDERDVALSGARALVALNQVHDDAKDLVPSMTAAYEQMASEQGDAPSPVLATYLGLQRPDAFDLIVVPPDDNSDPTDAVIFLHGFAGNFALPCWQVAHAVASLHVLTVCPSTRWVGDWGSPQGEATLRKTVELLHAQGVTKIVLAGLSAGGYGASQLAPRFHGAFVGLVLISGADPQAAAAGVPTLLIHGRKDTMAGYGDSVEYVANHAGAKLVSLDAGHFAMLVRRDATDPALREFVGRALTPTARSARRSP